ncbi:MAG: hypothetical protein ACK5P7_05470 [Bdellovibrio sp.]
MPAKPAVVRGVLTDTQRIYFDLGDGARLTFDPSLHFQAASDELTTQALGLESRSRLVINENFVLNKSDFQKMMHVWPEMPLKASWTSRLQILKAAGDSVTVLVRKGLMRTQSSIEVPRSIAVWLGCARDTTQCLGMTDTISNPNLLNAVPTALELNLLNADEIKDLQARTAGLNLESLKSVFLKNGFPNAMAEWMGLKLLARRHALVLDSERDRVLNQLQAYSSLPLIKNGQLMSAPEGFETDLTLHHLEARLNAFLLSRLDDVQKLAEFVLRNFPYMTLETEKSIGGWSVSPGFMIRVNRRIEKNVHARSVLEQFRIEDSLEVFASVTVGPHFERGILSASAGVGPAYLRRYTRVHMAASEEDARKGYWKIPKDLILRKKYVDLEPRERLTIQSGWLANASLNGNIRILGQSKVRPQAWVMGNHQWLSLSHVYRAHDGDLYFGHGNSKGFEVSSQAFWRVISKIARIPVLNFRKAWMSATNAVYKVDAATLSRQDEKAILLKEAIESGDLSALNPQPPRVQAQATYQASELWLDWGLGNYDRTQWSGVLQATPPSTGTSWLSDGQNFFLLERTETDQTRFSIGPGSQSERCSYWAALAIREPKERDQIQSADITDSTFKISCAERFEGRQMFEEVLAHRLIQKLNLDTAMLSQIWNSQIARKNTDLQWSLVIDQRDLTPLFADKPTGWLLALAQELESSKANPVSPSHEQSQERWLLKFMATELFRTKSAAKRLEIFFNWISQSGPRDLFLKAFLSRSQNHQIEIKRWTAGADENRLLFQEFKLGEVQVTPTFELLEERDKWFGH